MPDANGDLTCHPSARPVGRVVIQMVGILCLVGVPAAADHDRARRCHAGESVKKYARALRIPHQAEVTPRQQERIERARGARSQIFGRADEDLSGAPTPANLDGQGRDIERDHLQAPGLKIEA